jgi:hypothetical protein
MSLAGEVQGAILSVPGFDCDTALSADLARPAEILRGGSGIKVDGTLDHGLTISTYSHIKDAGGTPLARDLPGLICHQCAQSNELWLMAATRRSFLTMRDPVHLAGRHWRVSSHVMQGIEALCDSHRSFCRLNLYNFSTR